MNVDIFGSDGKRATKTADKNYVDLQFITLVKNLATKIDKSYVDQVFENARDEFSALIDVKVDKVAARIDGDLNMTEHSIYNVKDPLSDKDAVNKGYLDRVITERGIQDDEAIKRVMKAESLKLFTLSDIGLIPHLSSNDDKTGYTVTTSSELGENYGYKAFSPRNGQWRVNNNGLNDFWIEIKCLVSVKVHMITIKPSDGTKLINWKNTS